MHSVRTHLRQWQRCLHYMCTGPLFPLAALVVPSGQVMHPVMTAEYLPRAHTLHDPLTLSMNQRCSRRHLLMHGTHPHL